jgi:hypothetical protein
VNQASTTAPVALRSGQFGTIDAIHKGEGTAAVYRQPDGQLILRLDPFNVTNGPDLYVYLSTDPAPTNSAQLHQGGALEVARLKGNVGSQNYDLPADVDLSRFRSSGHLLQAVQRRIQLSRAEPCRKLTLCSPSSGRGGGWRLAGRRNGAELLHQPHRSLVRHLGTGHSGWHARDSVVSDAVRCDEIVQHSQVVSVRLIRSCCASRREPSPAALPRMTHARRARRCGVVAARAQVVRRRC